MKPKRTPATNGATERGGVGSHARPRWARRSPRAGARLAAVCVVALSVGTAEAGQALRASDAALVARGRQVFDQMKCVLCHSLEGKGGKLAVALDDIGLKRDAAAIRKVLVNPQAEFPTSKIKMPVFPLKDEEREALVAFLSTLRKSRS
jgi:mono/diheme cytochrome c family protein